MIFGFFKNRRRRRAIEKGLSDEQLRLLKQQFKFFSKLTQDRRQRFINLISIFLVEKTFVGCAGLEITEEMSLSIAAYACFLHLGLPHDDLYPDLRTIYVYPHIYKAKSRQLTAGNFVIESQQARAGESWHKGFVVLVWDEIKRGIQDVRDGHNVILHEFAHQLDQESGSMNGTPDLGGLANYATWGRLLSPLFVNLRSEIQKQHPTLIDQYGATNEAEFFAVLTETFFEKPKQLKRKHPKAYQVLQDFYGQDPTAYV